ncbi:MAG: hypothetical protein R3A44_41620 [Caldilineaceae bacterium]
MRKQTPTLEWRVIENEAEWERRQTLRAGAAPLTDYRLYVQKYAGNGLALLLLLVMAGAWWRWLLQARMQQAQAAATMTTQPALATVASAPAELVAAIEYRQRESAQLSQNESATAGISLAAASADLTEALNITLQSVAMQGDQAVVGIILADPSGAPVYRQTRFYRHTTLSGGKPGWRQTPPAASLWGAEQSLATPYFLYHFRQRDAAVVRAVAPTMDALYTSLWRNLGLPLDPTASRLVVDISIEQPPGQATLAFELQDPAATSAPTLSLAPGDPPTEPRPMPAVTVPSPVLYLAPVALSDVDLLAQSIALPLITYGLAQARQLYQIEPAWQPLLDGLYLWQVWDADLPLSSWRETVVQWQYIDLPAAQAEQVLPLPQHYQELCTVHKLWMHAPAQIYIPLACAGVEREEGTWHMWRASAPLTHLAQLAAPSSLIGDSVASSLVDLPSFTVHPGQTVALATLFEYATAAYGRESLPALLAALGDADGWGTLIPAVFGVSAAEFETGWQEYLASRYGILLDARR